MQLLRKRLVSIGRQVLDRLERRFDARRDPPTPPAPIPAQEAVVNAEPPPKPRSINWELRSQADLVDHILDHYHAGLRRDLPLIVEAARSVARAHRDHPEMPAGLTELLESLENELESHMLKEERVLFPVLRTGQRGGAVDMPIRMMEREHEGHDDVLAEIRTLTRDLTVPPGASAAWSTLYADIAAVETALREHIYLENNVLFARALGGEY